MSIRPATEAERPALLALLRQSALPVEDIAEAGVSFLVDVRDGEVAGVIGLQRAGKDALLRSLAVAPARRGQGLARQLVAALEADAAAQDIAGLYLLTQTAERFFSLQGFQVLPREEAPAPLQASAEFRSLCPASAVCMHKRISPAAG